jgi:hypothetical protein
MYHPIDKGTVIDVQGLKCYIPKPGWIYNPLLNNGEGGFEKIGVWKRNPNDKSQCYWQPDSRWKKWQSWAEEETERKKTDPNYFHPELRKFIADMWKYRLGGFWFSNNGTPTYITGTHWFYLSCYHLDIGLPKYRDPDREFFYAWEYCVEDPECFGLCYVTKRRRGKTFISGCIGIEQATRQANFRVGIQSKTDKDAKEVFLKAIINPFRKLPSFFKPNSNIPKTGKVPATELRFYSGKMSTEEDELESVIDFQPSNLNAYDGFKLGFYIADETGKTMTVNVKDRWDVVKYCLMDDEGKIIGKTLHTTTVEDMDSGGKPMLELWKGSNQNEKNGKRRTPTGMYKFFLSSDKTRFTDKYGIPNVKAAREQILEEREMIGDDPRSLAAAIRKEPLDEREAFMVDGDKCVFNAMKLNQRLDELKFVPSLYVRGNLHWKDGIRDTEVEFVESPNGRFMIAEHPVEDIKNQKYALGGHWYPKYVGVYYAGADTYDHRRNEESSRKSGLSDGALTILKDESILYGSPMDNGPVCLYVHRPPSPEIFYEDVLMACVYFSTEILLENNKTKIIDYFEDRGYMGYMVWLPGKNAPGVTAGPRSNNEIAEVTDQYINHHINKVPFIQLIEDWLEFDPAKTTKSDISMAFGYARMLQILRHRKPQHTSNSHDIKDLFGWYRRPSVRGRFL